MIYHKRLPLQKRIFGLDGLRGCAILIVMAYHLLKPCISMAPKFVMAAASGGWLGVDIFFVLSGFLITGILLRSKGSEGYFSNFYQRRAFRILPLYFALLGVFFFCRLELPYLRCVTFTINWLPHATEIKYVGNLWSLAIEEQFYLIWPAAVFFIPRRSLPKVCLLLATISVVTRCLIARSGHTDLAYSLPFSRMDGLSLGAFLATLDRWRPSGRLTLTIVLGCLSALLLLLAIRHTLDASAWQALTLAPLLVAVSSATTLLFVASPDYRGLLTNRVLVWFGQRSYGLYLLHQQLYENVERHFLRLPFGVLVVPLFGLGLACALAELSWRVLESPLLRLNTTKRPLGSVAFGIGTDH